MSEPTFSEFMAARWAPLYRTAYLLAGNAHEAEELLQNAMVKTCLRWDKIRDKQAADSYVRTTMANLATRLWRRRGRELPSDTLPEDATGAGLDVRADHLALWEQIRALPPRMRATLVLRFFDDLTVADTARELGCSVGAVKSQTHHALRRLRAALPDLEIQEDLR